MEKIASTLSEKTNEKIVGKGAFGELPKKPYLIPIAGSFLVNSLPKTTY